VAIAAVIAFSGCQPQRPPPGTITTVAGNGRTGCAGDGGPAARARLGGPQGIAFGPDGSLYVAQWGYHRVRRIDPAGIITTVAGNGRPGRSGDGGPATAARLNLPSDVAVGRDGSLYIADSYNHRIRRVDPAGIITTIAGSGPSGLQHGAFSGDLGSARKARLDTPRGVAVAPDGRVYIADSANDRIRMVDAAGIITTVGGGGPREGAAADAGPATSALLGYPSDVALDASGNLYVVYRHRVARVDARGVITTIAGNWNNGYSGDGGPATSASLSQPWGVAVAPNTTVYIADSSNHRVRAVGPDGIITTVAGDGWMDPMFLGRFAGDGGPATAASLDVPFAVAVAPDGSLYIADNYNNRIRKVWR
jgi:sugar lactone lactonase YvrE